MAHLLEPTHNARSQSLMDEFMPQWRIYRDELNQAPPGIYRLEVSNSRGRQEELGTSLSGHALEECSRLPDGIVIPGKSPDFTVESDAPTVGIEVTQIFEAPESGSLPPQVRDSETEITVQRAQDLAGERDLPPLMVDVFFASGKQIRRKDRERIATTLCDAVASNLPAVGSDKSIENRLANPSGLPPEIDAIHIYRFPSQKK